MKDLLRIADLTPADLEHLLDLSDRIRLDPHLFAGLLDGETVITYLAEPSTRTRLSFGSAITHLGGMPEVLGPNELQLGRGEVIDDTARVVSRYARAVVLSTFDDEDARRFAHAATVPVVNGQSRRHHPCQVLADLLTLRQHFGELRGRRLAYLGEAGNVAHSLLEAGALAGMDVVVATPPGDEPDGDVVRVAEHLANDAGCVVWVTHEPLLAVAGADAVYTGVWSRSGGNDAVRAARDAARAEFRVTPTLLREAEPDVVFLHRLPAHRGDEVTASVIDGPHSVVLDEAENRMHTAQALLVALLLDQLEGADISERRLLTSR